MLQCDMKLIVTYGPGQREVIDRVMISYKQDRTVGPRNARQAVWDDLAPNVAMYYGLKMESDGLAVEMIPGPRDAGYGPHRTKDVVAPKPRRPRNVYYVIIARKRYPVESAADKCVARSAMGAAGLDAIMLYYGALDADSFGAETGDAFYSSRR